MSKDYACFISRYLRVLEENASLKKHAVKQEDKLKKLATKLIRFQNQIQTYLDKSQLILFYTFLFTGIFTSLPVIIVCFEFASKFRLKVAILAIFVNAILLPIYFGKEFNKKGLIAGFIQSLSFSFRALYFTNQHGFCNKQKNKIKGSY